ncbi:MAG: GYF domain-containing protein, partial [Verrucomicrobium sp.]
MEWHYEKDGASVGPVSEAQLQAARSDGQISGSTRVWQVGWPDWRKAGEVWPASAAPSSGTTTAVCAECHRPYPEAQLFRFDNLTICENCKPMLLDKIRQGVTPGVGPWRHGKSMVIPVNTPLPDECFKCGAPPVKSIKKVLTWHPPLVYLALLPGVLVYIIVALCVRKTATVHIPLCRD